MMPFRISLTGTNCCVAPLGVIAISGLEVLGLVACELDVERPGEFGELPASELGSVLWGGRNRRGDRGALLCNCRILMFPEEELRARVVAEAGLDHLDERLAVYLIERERRGEGHDGCRDEKSDDCRQIREEHDTEAGRTGEIDEVL